MRGNHLLLEKNLCLAQGIQNKETLLDLKMLKSMVILLWCNVTATVIAWFCVAHSFNVEKSGIRFARVSCETKYFVKIALVKSR